MDKVMIASLLAGGIADRAAELAHHDDQRFIELASSAAARDDRKICNQIGHAYVQLARRRIDSSIRCIDVLMIVPSAERDLNVSRAEIRPKNVSCSQASISEPSVPVLRLI